MENYPVCDLHCDTILCLRDEQTKGLKGSLRSNKHSIDLEKLEQGGVRVQTFALFTDRKNGKAPEQEALSLLNTFQKALEENKDRLIQIRTRKDLEAAEKGEKIGALLSLEEGDVMFQDLSLLEFWQRMGVRLIALTWNYPNAIACPNVDLSDFEHYDYRLPSSRRHLETERGLTEYGKDYVRKCEELGILVDVSHLGDKAFWDLMDMAKKPVIASHSNCRALCDVSRNLDDDQIRAIAKTGGVIGLNFCTGFLNLETGDNSYLKDMVAHLDHLKEVGGIDVCAIGSDFDGITSQVEFDNAAGYGQLVKALEDDGWDERDIEKAMGGNVLRLLGSILPEE